MGKLTSSIGIPIKLLNEAQVRSFPERLRGDEGGLSLTVLLQQGHVVTLEITSGVIYRGKLLEGLFCFLSLSFLFVVDWLVFNCCRLID